MANGHGGVRPNSGNKTKQDFEKTNNIFINAIKQVKNVETDEEARIELAKDLLTFERGKIFISEHIFGKPKETIDSNVNINNFDIKDIVRIK
ncbi:hypothetical protein UFOVP622_11 [uncultured Caudovirales phage]|jgi:hypothetical protein|uniref:Uncharacterized protein n=1 Tax=uncultured Caudovirales phage TaxID=2100421 RepID=A0A6J5N2P3_9CAUD|nr:hypothetical protein UFOVP622_11 [uncultured Caudovirales phage]